MLILESIKPILWQKVQIKSFLCIFLFSTICLLSLFQSNILYVDDLKRVTSGITGWEKDARPLASWIMIILQSGTPLTDISPLTQLLAIVFYSVSSIFLGQILKVDNFLLLTISGIIFVLNPFNLQPYSYVFDSFTMGMAVLTAVSSYLIINKFLEQDLNIKFKGIAYISSVILLFCSLCIYQPAISIFLAILIFDSLVILVKNFALKKSLFNYFLGLSILAISLIIYNWFKDFYINTNYGLRFSQIPALADLPTTLRENLIFSLKYIKNCLGNQYLSKIIYILFGTVIVISVLLILKEFQRKKYLLLAVGILTLFYFLNLTASCYGFSLIMTNPIWQPRIFMGFTGVVGIACLYLARLVHLNRILKFILIFFLSLLCLQFANISATYGNVIYHQKIQSEIIEPVLLSDLETILLNLPNLPEKPQIIIINSPEPSILNTQAFAKYPILEKIATPSFGQHPFVNLYLQTREFRFLSVQSMSWQIRKAIDNFILSNPPITSNQIYNIYLKDNDIFIITFNKRNIPHP